MLSETDLVARLFAATTAQEIEDIIASVSVAKWRPLGDRANNYAPVNVGADAADALAEKFINGIDAIVEGEIERAGDHGLATPRAAAAKYLGVPEGHVWNVPLNARRALAERLQVTVRAGTAKDPTIVVRDNGIGQHPDRFPRTLVSLNESNKRDRLYLMGAYGWGGASGYAFCAYTLYVSRRDPALLEDGQRDEVGWTIVRYNPLTDDRTSKMGVYEYLVVEDAADPEGVVPRFDPVGLPTALADWHGTTVSLIDYRLGRYSTAAAWEPKESLWVISNALLFDPIMPFIIRDERPKSIDASRQNSLGGMVIHGTAARLVEAKKRTSSRRVKAQEQGDEGSEDGVTYGNTFHGRLPTGGAVTIRYWVFGESGKYKRDWNPTRSYVMPEQAVTVTHNGQRHMSYTKAVFDAVGYLSLSKSMLVQVDTDELDWPEKRELFSTTRDRLKETAVTAELKKQLDTALRQDEALGKEDKRRKERALARRSHDQMERIRQKLANAIEAMRKGSVQKYRTLMSTNEELDLFTNQLLVDPPEHPTDGTADDETGAEAVLYDADPTFIRVLNAPIRLPVGGRAVVRLAIDAPDDYFSSNPGRFLPIVSKGNESFSVVGFSDIRDGRMRCTVTAASASPNDRGRVIFTVLPSSDGLPLVDEAELVATERPKKRVKPAGKDKGKVAGGPTPEQIWKDQWDAFGFDPETVAKIEGDRTDPSLVTIYVNMDFPPVVAALMARKKASAEDLGGFQEGYCATMALLAWLQHEEHGETVNQGEMRRAAQAWIFTALSD